MTVTEIEYYKGIKVEKSHYIRMSARYAGENKLYYDLTVRGVSYRLPTWAKVKEAIDRATA